MGGKWPNKNSFLGADSRICSKYNSCVLLFFPLITPLTLDPYSVEQWVIKYRFWAFGMTRPGTEPRCPGPSANTRTIIPIGWSFFCRFRYQVFQSNTNNLPSSNRCNNSGSKWEMKGFSPFPRALEPILTTKYSLVSHLFNIWGQGIESLYS